MKLKDKIIDYRRTVHMNPEIAYQETQTNQYICEQLDALGIEYKTGYAKTGIVATINGKEKGKTIMIRADIDALPMQELNDVEYKSKNEGVMHACGHDAHIAGLLGAAELILNHKDDFKGSVKLLFQPSEEAPPGGAYPMIKDGAIGPVDNPEIDAAISLHIVNEKKSGTIGVKDGPFTGSSDEVNITIIGKGGHGSAPHSAVDPVHVAAQIAVGMQGWLTRAIDPVEPVVLTVGKITGGTIHNIIPNDAKMECTLRTLNEEVRDKVHKYLPKYIKSTAEAFGAKAEVEIDRGYAVGVNSKELNDHFRKVFAELFGKDNIMEEEKPVLGSEDFFEFGLKGKIPVAMVWFDTYNEEKNIVYPNHSPYFDVDDELLYMEAAILAGTAISFLNN